MVRVAEDLTDISGHLGAGRGLRGAEDFDGDKGPFVQLVAAEVEVIVVLKSDHEIGLGLVHDGDGLTVFSFDGFFFLLRQREGDFGVDERHGMDSFV